MKTMRNNCSQSCKRRGLARGFTMVELVLVMFIMSVVAAFAVPNVLLTISNWKLRGSASDLAGLMQQARILAAKNNPQPPVPVYAIRYAVQNGARIAFVDMKGDGVWHSSTPINGVTISEPLIQFGGATIPALGPPTRPGGQTTPYVLIRSKRIGSAFHYTAHLP